MRPRSSCRGTVEERRRKTQWTKGVIRALIVVCVFFIFQQITGINVPFYYGPKILATFFQSGHDAVAAAVAGVEVTAILGAVNVIATYFAFRWIDKFGRRPLAMGGYAGMAVFMLVAAAGVAFLTDIPKTVVVMVGFSFFITSFAIGVGGTGWLIQGEVFPTSVRGRAAAIAAAVDWVANFALIEAFPAWQNAWGLAWVMVSFAVLSVVAIGFVFKFLPETKGRSVEEVPTSVRGRAAAIGAAVDWVANFALIEAFPAWQNAWGLACGHDVLRGPVGSGDRIRVQVPARDKGPFRRGSRPDLREAGRGQQGACLAGDMTPEGCRADPVSPRTRSPADAPETRCRARSPPPSRAGGPASRQRAAAMGSRAGPDTRGAARFVIRQDDRDTGRSLPTRQDALDTTSPALSPTPRAWPPPMASRPRTS